MKKPDFGAGVLVYLDFLCINTPIHAKSPGPAPPSQKNSLFQKIMFTNYTLTNYISISCRRSVLELLLGGYIVLA
jgi:hypothetical protein